MPIIASPSRKRRQEHLISDANWTRHSAGIMTKICSAEGMHLAAASQYSCATLNTSAGTSQGEQAMWMCQLHKALSCALGHHLRKAAPLLLLRRRPGPAFGLLLPVAAPRADPEAGLVDKAAHILAVSAGGGRLGGHGALHGRRQLRAGPAGLQPAVALGSTKESSQLSCAQSWADPLPCKHPLWHACLKRL